MDAPLPLPPDPTTVPLPVHLPPAPRPLTGMTAALLDESAPGMLAYLLADQRPGDGVGVLDLLMVGLFSVLTGGVLPLTFAGIARARRRRLAHFLERGTPLVATITAIELEPAPFGTRMARVRYEYVAGARTHRDADTLRPVVADKWRAGDAIWILHADDGSVVLSAA